MKKHQPTSQYSCPQIASILALKNLGWKTGNPATHPSGQVDAQGEFRHYSEKLIKSTTFIAGKMLDSGENCAKQNTAIMKLKNTAAMKLLSVILLKLAATATNKTAEPQPIKNKPTLPHRIGLALALALALPAAAQTLTITGTKSDGSAFSRQVNQKFRNNILQA